MLRTALAQLESQQTLLARRRRRRLQLVGIGISAVVHLCLLLYLASQHRLAPGGRGPAPVSYEFAIMTEEELTELETLEVEDLQPEVADELDALLAEEAVEIMDPVVPAAELDVVRSGALPTLGGGGDASGGGGELTGGGAGASFFGVTSRGMRFAYIVDRSGSMGDDRKMEVAMRELARSISGVPDYASVYLVLFSSDTAKPPMQTGWMRARRSTINRLIRWLRDVDPTGGTVPMPAFHDVFALDVRPDVIFFLTDGEIPKDTGDLLADLNQRGGRVVINTIAFGDASSQDLLRRIARESGGVYRFVRTEGP
ncbi:MAG: VWA domain-containing protein [Phycisphaerales bacterium]|nr:VWA domain-containing protein [Phycisphaerae bacterium]NNF41494.1 VWA domain-containing protein [Phycisphaerales bacterium]NNM25367.1 VWA domain-containing protein [Phycisphaerales bacterium]